ncbi:DUF3987 domain-containing protein [Acidovorax lacteus]
MSTPAALFHAAVAATGISPPDLIQDDGNLHRFSTNGTPGNKDGWYVLYGDGVPAGTFGCWRNGFSQTWSSKPDTAMTQAERDAHGRRIQEMRAQRNAYLAERQQQARTTAVALWQAAAPAMQHEYLARKGIQPHGARCDGYRLVIPLRDVDGTLHSLQTIAPDGDKRFMPGGRVVGCYHSMGKPKGLLVVCEGFATGASIHEATGHAVAVAFNAGNLLPVAQALHGKYPALRIIVAADDDWRTDGNPGLTKAAEAAQAVGGDLSKPDFGDNRPEKATDFNDLHQLLGLDAVKACIDGVVTASTVSGWADPVPLPSGLPPVAPFDAELLPEALRDWVADIADRMQCPPDFTAVGALVALSSLIGARAVVKPKARDDWAVTPNLWGAIVGRPGVMKSPALSEVLKPLQCLEKTEREQWQAAHEAWQLDCKVVELAAKANEKQVKAQAAKDPAKARALLQSANNLTPAPTMRRYVVNDATVEKLADLLTVNPWGTLVYRDEIHGLLCSMDKQGQEGARGFYLTGYDGNQGHAVDRIGRGESFVPRVCLAMLGGIQPGKVQSYVREAVAGGAGDDGLLQRFGLTVWPDVNREFVYVDRWPDTPAKQAAWAVFERLSQLQPATNSDAQEWRFTPKAQVLFEEWLIPFETELRGDELHPALVSHLAKYRKLIPALALIFALVDTPDSENLIHERELIRALAWADYLRTHAERLYAAAVMPETSTAKQLLDKITSGKLTDSNAVLLDAFAPRQVAVKHWAGLGTPDAVRKAADLLADYGWLVREATPSGAAGGRPGERYVLHPMLVKGGRR